MEDRGVEVTPPSPGVAATPASPLEQNCDRTKCDGGGASTRRRRGSPLPLNDRDRSAALLQRPESRKNMVDRCKEARNMFANDPDATANSGHGKPRLGRFVGLPRQPRKELQ